MNKLMTATHWGAYEVEAEDGRVLALTPFSDDPDPSPIGFGMPQALHDPVRILEPMVRKRWLERGSKEQVDGRGKGPFVSVSWDRASTLSLTRSSGFAKSTETRPFTPAPTAGPAPGAFTTQTASFTASWRWLEAMFTAKTPTASQRGM